MAVKDSQAGARNFLSQRLKANFEMETIFPIPLTWHSLARRYYLR